MANGLTDEELRAVRLLTRSSESRSDAGYLAHIDLIVRASGPAGDLARMVKRVDLEDRLWHPRERSDGWRPPYQLALELLRVRPATLGSDAGRDPASHRTPDLAPPGLGDHGSATKPSMSLPGGLRGRNRMGM